MRKFHAQIEYKCYVCGNVKHLFVEKGVCESLNVNLKKKSGLPDKDMPDMIPCPLCRNRSMHEHGFWGRAAFLPMNTGMHVILNNPDSKVGVAVFKYKEEMYVYIERDWNRV